MSAANGKHHPKPFVVAGATHVEVADVFMDGKAAHKSIYPVAMLDDATAITAKIRGTWFPVTRWLREGREVKSDD